MYKNSNKKRRKIQDDNDNQEKEKNFKNIINNDEIKPNDGRNTTVSNKKKEYTKKKNKKSNVKENYTSKFENNLQDDNKENVKENSSKKKKKHINKKNSNKSSNKNSNNSNNDNDNYSINNNGSIKNKNKLNNKNIKRNDNETDYDKNIIKENEAITNEQDNNNEKKKPKHYLIENSQDKSLLLNNLSALEENKLYVKNITENIKKEDLEDFFSKIPGYKDTRIVYDSKGKLKKFAYVEFDNNENATNFLNTLENSNAENYKILNLKNVNLLTSISNPLKSVYEKNRVFIKFTKCSDEIDSSIKEKISNFLLNHSILVKDIRLLGGSTDKHGYIELENNDDVIKCVETIKICELNNLEFTLNYSIPIIKKKVMLDLDKIKLNKEKTKKLKEERKREENSCTIVVRNLHFNTRKHKLQSFFEKIGEIENIYLSKKISENNIKRNKGFAYITFKNPNDATSSLILNDSILDGRNILISTFSDGKTKKYTNDKTSLDFNKNIYENKKNKNYYVNENYFYEKKRINLSKSTDNIINEKVEKRCDYTTGSMTNEDFRKLFLK